MNKSYQGMALAIITVAAMQSGAVFAQSKSEFSSSANVAFVNDYRFRGISLNDDKPTVQASLTVSHESGFYLTGWGSAFSAIPGDSSEIAVYTGYQKALSEGVGVDVGVVIYLFPGDSGINFYEVYGSVSKSFGAVTSKLGIYYAPKQGHVRAASGQKDDNVYVYGSAAWAIPNTAVSLSAQLGYENGPRILSTGGKVDWDVGASVNALGLTWAAHYLDSDAPDFRSARGKNLSKPKLFLSLSKAF